MFANIDILVQEVIIINENNEDKEMIDNSECGPFFRLI